MKLLFSPHIFQLQKTGGASRYFYEMLKRFLKVPALELKLPIVLNKNLYLVENRLLGIKNSFPNTRGLTRLASLLNETVFQSTARVSKPDIIHFTYYSKNFPTKHARLIITVLDMIHERFPLQTPYYFKTLAAKKETLERADGIICISHNTRKDLADLYNLRNKRVKVIHLASSYKGEKSDLSVKKKNYLLYIGDRHWYKNFDNFISALALSKHLKEDFEIVFFGGNPLSSEEKNFIKSSGLALTQIKQVFGNDAILKDLYKHAAALIYPSKYEGFGIPVLEAMSLGCPVICSNISSLPEVGGSAAVYFNPDDITNMAEVIESTIYSSDKLINMQTTGLARANQFSWDKCAHETLGFYEEILD